MKHTLTIDIGEKTCAKFDDATGEPIMCPFVRVSHFGTVFSCGIFQPNMVLGEQDGVLMRNDECLSTLKPTEEKA